MAAFFEKLSQSLRTLSGWHSKRPRSPFLFGQSTVCVAISASAVLVVSSWVPTAAAASGIKLENRGAGDVFMLRAPAGFKPVLVGKRNRNSDLRAWTTTVITRDECEVQIKKAVCSTTASSDMIVSQWSTISCDVDSSTFVPAIMDLFDEMPDLIRPSLCTLSRIFISDSIQSTAFASPIRNGSGMPVGGVVGFRKGTFLNQPDTIQLMSWKEQLPFGGSTDFLTVDPNLVHENYSLKMGVLKHDALFYVFMHELGHLIDFDNNINGVCEEGCRTTKTGWSDLSWESENQPLPAATFLSRDDFCYYNCSSHLPASNALKIYQSLAQSSFVSTYAAVNTFEDFAENWAWYQMRKFKNPQYVIQIPNQGEVNMTDAMNSNPHILEKLKFIDDLWNNPDLKVAH